MADEITITIQEVKNLKKEVENEVTRIFHAFETRTGLEIEDINYDMNTNGTRPHAFIYTNLN